MPTATASCTRTSAAAAPAPAPAAAAPPPPEEPAAYLLRARPDGAVAGPEQRERETRLQHKRDERHPDVSLQNQHGAHCEGACQQHEHRACGGGSSSVVWCSDVVS